MHKQCTYCGLWFGNIAGYEQHLKPQMNGCMTETEMHRAKGFSMSSGGWKHEAPVVRRKRANKRPQELLIP